MASLDGLSFTSLDGKYALKDSIAQSTSKSYFASWLTFTSLKTNSNKKLTFDQKYCSFSTLPSQMNEPDKTIQKSKNAIQQHEQLAKIISFRQPDTAYYFLNIGKSLIWADFSLEPRVFSFFILFILKDPLSVISFKDVYVTCHDVNLLTDDNMDTIIGLSSGDIVWFTPVSCKYNYFNKQGVINKSCITCIRWLPGSESEFMVSHEDGSIIIYDREKEDANFSPLIPTDTDFSISKSRLPSTLASSLKLLKTNPVAWWNCGKRAITSFSFSPDFQHVAVVSMDGTLRIIDYLNEKLCDTYHSFFGGLTCVCWSPDGRFILTGGQDDLITIWAFKGGVVARCQGHSSWISSVSFDPYKCTDRSYRFGSVAEDAKLCLWDFTVSSLYNHHRKVKGGTLTRRGGVRRGSIAEEVVGNLNVAIEDVAVKANLHEVLGKTEVTILEPIMCAGIGSEPLCHIVFREDAVVTTDRVGVVKIWSRPPGKE